MASFLSQSANAHLMVAQNGTLKLGKGGYYFVLSLPVSAISGFDDDKDGLMSPGELTKHQGVIQDAVRRGFQLESRTSGLLLMEGLVLNLAHSHGPFQEPEGQVVAMGRFSVGPTDKELTLKTSLFGKSAREKSMRITITKGMNKQQVTLNAERSSIKLFAK